MWRKLLLFGLLTVLVTSFAFANTGNAIGEDNSRIGLVKAKMDRNETLTPAEKAFAWNNGLIEEPLAPSANYNPTNLRTAYLDEGFEVWPPVGWTLTPATGTGAWLQGNGTSHGPGSVVEGASAAWFDDYNYAQGTMGIMTSPAIDLSAATAPRVVFWYWDGSGSDAVVVAVSTDGTTFTDIYAAPGTVTPWTETILDLTSYAGNATVYIQFKGTSVYGTTNPHIDAFTVVEAPTDPIITLSAVDIAMTSVPVGLTSSYNLVIGNSGGADLVVSDITSDTPEFTVSPSSGTVAPGTEMTVTISFAPGAVMAYTGALSIVSNDLGSPAAVAVAGSGLDYLTAGGPDALGYTWVNNLDGAGPEYSWIDTVGSVDANIAWGDDIRGTIDLPFDFRFYDNYYSQITATTNGWIGMGPSTAFASSYWTNTTLPSTTLPNNILAPLWDDFKAGDSPGSTSSAHGLIKYKTLGVAPDRQFVVIFDEIVRGTYDTDYFSFEVIFDEATSNITYQYADVSGNTSANNGIGATIGIENMDATDGLLYTFNGVPQLIYDGVAIEFVAPEPPTEEVLPVLISEIVVTPTGGEFVELYNPYENPINLTNYYLTDATYAAGSAYYYNITTGANYGGGSSGDFHARFPADFVILPGQYLTVALAGSDAFMTEYGMEPDLELFEDGEGSDAIPDMLEAMPGSINNQGGLTNSDEIVVIYYWDGASDLVQDSDYLLWDITGAVPNEAVDKSGVTVGSSTYLNDTPIANQVSAMAPTFGYSLGRVDPMEGMEVMTGGNGITGHDETSEDVNMTFAVGLPSPGAAFRPADFNEPNDNITTATEVMNGDSLLGIIDPADDLDFFTFSVEGDVEFAIHMYVNGISLLDPELRLFDADSVSLASADGGASGGNETLTGILSTGTYYLVAGYYGDVLRADLGAYTITFDWAPYVISQGETCEDPYVYGAVNDEAMAGDLVAGAHDWYSFTTDGSYEQVTISTCGGVGLTDSKLAVFASCDDFVSWPSFGAPVGAIGYVDDGCGTGYLSNLNMSGLEAGEYYVAVYGYGATYAGAYTLNITGVQDPCAQFVDTYEPNDDMASAVVLASETISGSLCPTDDADWFAVHGLTLGTITVETAPLSVDEYATDTYLTLYDADGNVLDTDDDGGLGFTSMISFDPMADGVYYFVVTVSSWAAGDVFDYTMTVTIDDPPLPVPQNLVADAGDGFVALTWEPVPLIPVALRTNEGVSALKLSDPKADLDPRKQAINDVFVWKQADQFALMATDALRDAGDTCGEAIDYGAVNATPVAGDLVAGGAVWYSFTTDGSYQQVTASLCGGSGLGDSKIAVFADCADFTGVLGAPPEGSIGYNDDYCGLLSQISMADLGAGTYYVVVWGYSATSAGAFELAVTGVADPCEAFVDTYEPNDVMEDATVAGDGDMLNAALCPTDDYDYFAIDGLAFGVITVETAPLSFDEYATDTYLTLYDADGNVIDTDDDGGLGYTSMISYELPTDGTYYFLVTVSSYAAGDVFDYSLNVTVDDPPTYIPSYTVYREGSMLVGDLLTTSYLDEAVVNYTEYCYTVTQNMEDLSESGPSNEACATPMPPQPGEVCDNPLLYQYVNDEPQTGAIESYGAVWYSFEVMEDMAGVTVSLCGSDYDTKVEVWADCDDATYIAYNDDFCGLQSQVELADVMAGVYYVKVYGFSAAFGNYVLSVTGGQAGSSCDLAIDAVMGENAADGSSQWFAYTATMDGVVMVSSQNEAGDAPWDTYLEVYDSCDPLADPIAINDDCCGYWGPSTAEFLGETGMTYYIFWGNLYEPGPFAWFIDEMPDAPTDLVATGFDGFIGLTWTPPLGAVAMRNSLPSTAATAQNTVTSKQALMEAAQQEVAQAKRAATPGFSQLTQPQILNMTQIDRRAAMASTVPYTPVSLRTMDVTFTIGVDAYPEEASWNIWDYGVSAYLFTENMLFTSAGEVQTLVQSLDDGDYSVDVWDSYGDGGIAGMVTIGEGTVIASWTADAYDSYGYFDFTVLEGGIYGCTDPEALNYNEAATVDDGSCEYPVEVCDDTIVPDGVAEVEPNGGLNMDPVEFDPRACGDMITGTYWAGGGSRDTDWYNFTLAEYATVEAFIDVSCGDPQIYILNANATAALGVGNANGEGEGEMLMTGLLPPGDYWFWVGSQVFEGDLVEYHYNAGFVCTPQEPTSYTVYRDGELLAADVPGAFYTDGAVSNGVEYCYTVTATTDGVETAESNEACASPAVFYPEPMGLMATAFDSEVGLEWSPPFPMGQLAADDGTAESWYWVSGPTTATQMFYARLTVPSAGVITHIAVWNAADEPINWNSIYVTGDNGSGAPDLTGAYEVFTDVPVATPIGAGGEWAVLELATPAAVTGGQALYIVTQWPDASSVGPFVATDMNTNLGNAAWTNTSGATWNNVAGTFIMRAYMQTVTDRQNIEITTVPRNVTSYLPLMSLDENKAVRIKREQFNFSLSAPVLQSDATRDLTGYQVYRGTEAGTLSIYADNITETMFSDMQVTNGTPYYYAVTAIYDGMYESGFSNEIMAIPMGAGAVPYANNFDETNGGFVGGGDWQWGAPADPPGANSAPNVWGTILGGDYSDATTSYLELPFDLSGSEYGYELSFMHSQSIENGWDYGYVGVDYDGSGYWVLSAYTGDMVAWTSESVIIPPELCSAYTKVAFIFVADGNTVQDGWYIDDVSINPFLPAIIAATPEAISEALEAPASMTTDLVISNVGGLDLEYYGMIEYIDGTVLDSVFFDNFDDQDISDWTVIDGFDDGNTWYGEGTGGSTLDGTPHAIVDSDAAGDVDMDEIMISPVIDAEGALSLTLEWDQYFNTYSGTDVASVDVWDGIDWVNVYTTSQDAGYWNAPDHPVIDITGLANADLQVRFHYVGHYEWWWAVDNVLLTVAEGVPWVTVDGGVTFDGMIAASGADNTHLVSLSTEGLDNGTYHANIYLMGNGGELVIPVEFVVSGVVSASDNQIPTTYALEQNYPNPFNPITSIKYQLPEAADVRILVYNVLGQRVATLVDGSKAAGYHSVRWNGTNDMGASVSSGVYIYRIETEKFTDVKKLMFLK